MKKILLLVLIISCLVFVYNNYNEINPGYTKCVLVCKNNQSRYDAHKRYGKEIKCYCKNIKIFTVR